MADRRFKTVDEYLKAQPAELRDNLLLLRESIRAAAPHAEELIRYNIPTYKQEGTLAYFAVRKNHIGFYPFRSAINKFRDEIETYETSQGTIRFSMDKNIPASLIKKMVKFRLKENLGIASLKKLKLKKRVLSI
jgi:uncharacterized protein YdhG (YjbR/CyaY superfamily)